MLHRIPRHLPPLALLLDDIGNPSAPALALALGVTARTVRRWRAHPDETPRLVLLALFWVSRWGHSAVHCEAANSAALANQVARCRDDEIKALRADLARVLALGDTGAANDASLLDVRPISRSFDRHRADGRGSPRLA